MMLNNNGKLIFTFFLIAMISVIYMVISYHDISVFFSFLIFLLFIFFIERLFKIDKKIYIAYFVFVSVMPLFLYSFSVLTGDIYIPGGDSEKYYLRVVDIAKGDESQLWGRYSLFLYIGKILYQTTYLLFNSYSYIHFALMSSFFASLTIDPIHRVVSELFDRSVADKTVWLWIFTPLLWYLSSGSLRDIYVYFSVLYGIFFIISFIRTSNLWFLIFSFLCLVYTANIRLDSAIFLAFFITSSVMLHKGKLYLKFTFLLLFLSFLTFVVSQGLVEVFKFNDSYDLSYQVDAYKDLRAGSSGSLTSKLQGTALGFMVLPFFTLITPFPPPVFFAKYFNISDLFISLFSLLFIMILPRFFISSWHNKNDKFILSFVLSLIFIILILSMTSVGSFRQKLYLYPIIYSLFISCRSSHTVYKIELIFISSLSVLSVFFIFIRYVV
ncbi:TPA: hypothetical protein NKT21_001961 [Vibrio parahaemolyticus]|nr:hypothetical protein [Vibrio parahaemolyticus]